MAGENPHFLIFVMHRMRVSLYYDPMEQLSPQQVKDLKILITFVSVYCQARHGGQFTENRMIEIPSELSRLYPRGLALCTDCAGLVAHALEKRRLCPLEPKPSCKKCHIHCYSRQHREQIRQIMAFSGRRLILRGRLQYLWHYFF
jgi:hypothetical protein